MGEGLVQSTEAGGLHYATSVKATPVAQLHLYIGVGRPSTVLLVIAQPQFVDPYFGTFHLTRVIAYANHYGFYVGEGRIAHNRNGVGGISLIGRRVAFVIIGTTGGNMAVAGYLQIGQLLKGKLDFVRSGPYGGAILSQVATIHSVGRKG